MAQAGEGEFSANVPGTDVIFLSGRTDVVIPNLGVYDPAFPLTRHGFVLGDFVKETFPKPIAAKSGMVFKFSATGAVHYYNGPGYGSGYGPDGGQAGSSYLYPLGGISGYQGPQGPLVGVFLSDADPAQASPPEILDFSGNPGTSFQTLSPKLAQVFFIGNGHAADGTQQSFIAPDGATRLYLAIPDGFGFWGLPGAYEDNDGSFPVQASYALPNCVSSGLVDKACFYDDFNDNAVSTFLWSTGVGGSGPVLSETGSRLEVSIPSSSNNNGQTGFSAGLGSTCKLKGDFDIQVDYSLPTWPSANGVRVGLGTVSGPVERVSFGSTQDYYGWPREVYLTHFSDGVQGIAQTADLSGKLRLVRTGNTATGYYSSNGAWVPVDTGPSSAADTAFSFSAWSHDYTFTKQDVKVAFDNLIINKGELLCANEPPVAEAGPDQTVECAGPSCASVTLDGSGSSDPQGDDLTYTWTWTGGTASGVQPVVSLPLGATEITLTVNDGKGGTASDTVTITVQDTIPPAIIGSVSPAPNGHGWNNTDVIVAWTCADTGSGIASCPAATTLTAEGAGQAVTGEAVDTAGNRVTAQVVVNIDKTLPVITAAVAPVSNAYGWNNGNVTITFDCSDAGSGIATCPSPLIVTTEGEKQTVAGTTTDKAGNTAKIEVTLNIDKTAPSIAITGAMDGATYPACSAPTLAFMAADALSGILSQNGALAGGNANGVNLFTYTVTASDRAGNIATSTVTYRVAYDFGGFIAPVTLAKSFKKGSTIPVKFTLTDGCGSSVTSAIASLTLQFISGQIASGDPIDAASNVPDSGNIFRYSGSDGIYIYNLATNDLVPGSYLATVTTDDGVARTVTMQIAP
jgi:hypothetical protein